MFEQCLQFMLSVALIDQTAPVLNSAHLPT